MRDQEEETTNKIGQPNNYPWFDKECLSMKNKMKQNANLVKKQPHNKKIRESLYVLKRQYKNIVKKKKKEYKTSILDEMKCNRKNSRSFWKILDKLIQKPNNNIFKRGISGYRWMKHFRSLFTTENRPLYPNSPNETGCLDYEITSEEIEEASYILRPMKSSGIDGISNEMILCLLKINPKIILKLFNAVLFSENPITTWNTSIISAIHKKGSKMDPDNY